MSMTDGRHREVEVGGRATCSSSPELSSPPKSPESPSAAALATATHTNADLHSPNSTIQVKIGGGVEKIASAPTTTTGHTLAKNNIHNTPTAAPKRVRKKKDPNATTAAANGSAPTATEGKDHKIRKPRTQASASTTARKRQKTDASSAVTKTTASRQSKLTELVGSSHNSNSTITLGVPPRFASPQTGNSDAIPKTSLAFVAAGQPTPLSRSSGQNYDPIRSTTMEAPPVSHNPFSAPPVSPTPPRIANRASASPSIASLIDPPIITKSTPSIPLSHPARQASSNVATPTPTPTPAPPSPTKVSVSPSIVQSQKLAPTVIGESPPWNLPDQAMQLDAERDCLPVKAATKKVTAGASTGQSSSTASPKPARRKDAPRSLPPGNGLLSSALFGGPSDFSAPGTDSAAPTVILHIPMNGETNKYINFARLAEERYGFNALHPRLAAQRERLARIAAAGAALEKGSGSGSAEEMSVDLSEGESNVEMGGTEGGCAVEGKKPVKKKQKADQYDKEDPFVDDSELLWEEQAAASKDGFFVYSGPLVPEGEKPTIERADGTVKRGRGRGRAATARGTAANRGATAAAANTAARGTTATRKPRVTKAARALMEQEKIDREKMAVLAAKPSTYPG